MNRFQHVVQILDTAIGGSQVNIAVHGAFWRNVTRDQFVTKKVQGLDLLIVGNGAASNLVKALKGESPFGADLDNPPSGARFDRMPSGLPPVPDDDIAFIQKWIDDGCPADSPSEASGAGAGTAPQAPTASLHWRPTNAPVASSRTDDIWFTDPHTGWAVNSNGQIVHTADGGDTWAEQLHDAEVYFRCIGFASPSRGWAGTLTGHKSLFETRDGGTTWSAVGNLPALAPSAVCGMSVVSEQVVYLAGTNFPNRPPRMMKTTDGGATWTAWEMKPWASILIDTYFTSPDRGWVVGGKTDEPVATRNNVKAVVLFTEDGGRTWVNRAASLQGELPMGEWGWKIQFLNDQIGFVSLENFTAGAILKTTDGGLTWSRIPVTDPQRNANLEGVGFLDESHGWVGGWGDVQFQRLSTSETTDGGRTWQDANEVGKALNRFRFFGNPVSVGYASGQTVYKYTSQPAGATHAMTAPRPSPALLADPQPRRVSGPLRLPLTVPTDAGRLTVRVWDRFGDLIDTPVDEQNPSPGPRTIEWDNSTRDPGYFIVRVTVDDRSESQLVQVGPRAVNGLCSQTTATGESAMTIASHVVVPGSERRLLPGSKVLGTADPNHRIEVTIKLRRKAPLPPLTGRPKEPMTRGQCVAEYGASDEDIAKVTDVLQRYGLEVMHSNKATRSVVVAGPISAMEQAFEVKLFRYSNDQGQYRGRSGMLHVPAELNGIAVGVYGLDNRRVIHRRGPATLQPHVITPSASGANRGFLPADLAKLYGFPDGDGTDQTIGILEFGGRIQTDALNLFCQRIGIDVPQVIEVDIDGGATDTGDDPSGEVMLDIEVVAGICPKATIPVYFGPTFDERSWVDTIDQAIHDDVHNPTVLSISWGNSEDGPQSAWQQGAIDHVNESLQEAALMGVTVCVASGDDGSDDQGGDGKAHVDFPASSPFVLAVGGTDLRVRNGSVTERAWKDGSGLRPEGGSSGGGVSVHFDRPTFQNNISIKSVNRGAILGRVVPDVAAHAQSDGRRTGYFFVADGPFGVMVGVNGGTSASAPLWAALIARINAILEKEKGAGSRIGYLTPVLYQAGEGDQPIGATVCKDITAGDNISAHGGGYRASPGFDAVTGWGSPIGTKLLNALRAIV